MKKTRKDVVRITLPEIADVSVVAELQRQAVTQWDKAKEIQLDGHAVQRLDAAVSQWLLTLIRAAQARRVPVSWVECSPALVGSARLLGMTEALCLSAVVHGDDRH